MRKIREVLRLRFERGLSQREVSAASGVSKGSVTDYLRRARVEGISWEIAQQLNDHELEQRLFCAYGPEQAHKPRAPIDFSWVHRELARAGVTLQQLWLEYREALAQSGSDALPYQYTQFCVRYAAVKKTLQVSMRQTHRAGEKVFVDYSGKHPHIYDRETGERVEVELFVGVLGASNYTFAEATRTQKLGDFVGSNIRMLEYFGGVPEVIVPDQLRSAVKGPERYDPELNPTYAEFAQHYDVAIIPARPRRPRDKAKVEVAVLVAQRWILATLRNQKFFSLEELNDAISEKLELLNNRPFKKLEGSRRSLYESIDRPTLRQLPARRYQLGKWKKATVNIDYHVEYDARYYSTSCKLVRQPVELRATESTIEIYHQGQRHVTHRRSYGPKGTAVTLEEHRPKAHRDYGQWPPSRIISWAHSLGPSVAKVVEHILQHRPHPEQGYRSCMALLRDAKSYPKERVDAACQRALLIGSPTRKSVQMILKRRLENAALDESTPSVLLQHDNIRGGAYYDRKETS